MILVIAFVICCAVNRRLTLSDIQVVITERRLALKRFRTVSRRLERGYRLAHRRLRPNLVSREESQLCTGLLHSAEF